MEVKSQEWKSEAEVLVLDMLERCQETGIESYDTLALVLTPKSLVSYVTLGNAQLFELF